MVYFFFYLPLGLEPRSRRPAWATWTLLSVAVLAFALDRAVPGLVWGHYESLIYIPAAPTPTALLCSTYMHADWFHLLSNMLALLVFGPALEERLGALRFVLLFHLFALCGNFVQGAAALLLAPETAGYGILGASGAIAGLMGLLLVRLHFARIRIGYWTFMPLQAYTEAGTRSLPIVVAVFLWFLIQIGLVVAQSQGSQGGIAVGSHLGGLAAGIACGLMLGLRHEAAAEHHLHRGRDYLGKAQWFAAQGEFLEYVRRRSHDAEGHLELARACRIMERHVEADDSYRAACVLWARRRRLDRVEEAYEEALRGNPGFVLPAPLQWQLATLLERAFKLDRAETAYRLFARVYSSKTTAPVALFRAARLAQRRDDEPAAQALFRTLVAEYPDAAESELARRSSDATGQPLPMGT